MQKLNEIDMCKQSGGWSCSSVSWTCRWLRFCCILPEAGLKWLKWVFVSFWVRLVSPQHSGKAIHLMGPVWVIVEPKPPSLTQFTEKFSLIFKDFSKLWRLPIWIVWTSQWSDISLYHFVTLITFCWFRSGEKLCSLGYNRTQWLFRRILDFKGPISIVDDEHWNIHKNSLVRRKE